MVCTANRQTCSLLTVKKNIGRDCGKQQVVCQIKVCVSGKSKLHYLGQLCVCVLSCYTKGKYFKNLPAVLDSVISF